MGYAPVGVFHALRCPVVVSAVAEALGEQPIQLSAANANALGDAGHGKAVGHGGAHQRDRTHQVAAQVRPAAVRGKAGRNSVTWRQCSATRRPLSRPASASKKLALSIATRGRPRAAACRSTGPWVCTCPSDACTVRLPNTTR